MLPPLHVVTHAHPHELEKYVEACEPCLFKGMLEPWQMFRELRALDGAEDKMRLLLPHLGEEPVVFTATPSQHSGHLGYAEDLRTPSAPRFGTPPDAFARLVARSVADKARPVIYAHRRPVDWSAAPADFLRELATRCGFAPGRASFWIGTGGHVSSLHFDDKLNLMCLLSGEKRVTLFPPAVSADLYPGPPDGPFGTPTSYVTLLDVDQARFPRVARALEHALVAELNAGDMLLLPPFWWHHVESFGLNIMLSSWFSMASRDAEKQFWRELRKGAVLFAQCKGSERALARAMLFDEPSANASRGSNEVHCYLAECRQLLATLHPFWQQAVRHIFDYYVFQTDGTPMATVPGEFENMVDRFARAP